ncbi:MAG: hypothetical protein GY765_32345, partial [bacterium]|nr:hypothetical protein [bacterium]
MSLDGMKLLVSSLLKKRSVFINLESEDVYVELKCYIRWIRKQLNVYNQPQYQVGVIIPNPPAEYMRLVKNYSSTASGTSS